jgi:3-phenylpropionate/cinnamic acid dioxygenase small subunit
MTITSETAITNLLHRYGELVDAGDFDALSAMFADADYLMRGGTPLRGAQVGAAMRATVKVYNGLPRTRHVMTNAIVDIADDNTTATARSSFTVFQATDGFPLQPILVGGYHDTLVNDTDSSLGWRFARREIHVDLVGDTSHHVRISMGGD